MIPSVQSSARRSAIRVGAWFLGLLAALNVTATCDWARAQDPLSLQRQAAAHLRAGEFGPAIALANQAGDPALRDRMLAAVARSQAAAGARPAAIDTLNSISDGQLLDEAARSVAAEPMTSGPRFGGGTQADFTQLIDLITRTVAPTTWDAVGGPGAISEFPGGVYVDAQGVLNRLPRDQTAGGLEVLRLQATRPGANQDLASPSQLRKVSLTRLERQLQLAWAQGLEPTQAMRYLAGLQRVRYVFVYPDSGDLVIAGPAGDWTEDGEGRVVSRDSGVPVLQLDDFVVLLRNTWNNGGRYSCSINPRQENLAATKQFLESLPQRSLRPEEGAATRAKLRETLGQQDIEVKGIDPRTRAAQVIVEADYRMKLVGMGLEDGVLGVESYLDSIEIGPGAGPPPTSILRWWFAMEYQPLQTTAERTAFQLRGQGAKVLSENAMITEAGERVFVGNTDPLTEQFASSFTTRFGDLATKYPVYADLRNIFDLSLVAALLVAEDLPARVGWQMPFFRDEQRCPVQLGCAPTAVETVIHHRKIRQGRTQHIVTGVSGGVTADPNPFVQRDVIVVDRYGTLDAELGGATPSDQDACWWWD